jgi:O-antigen biosynthesis protein
VKKIKKRKRVSDFCLDNRLAKKNLNNSALEIPAGQSISLCMIVKDEEANLGKCLMSVKALVNESIVVDTGSRDSTREVAMSFGAKVFNFNWTNSFADARNYSLAKATGKWIFILDADEVISTKDIERVRLLVRESGPEPVAFSFTTRNYVQEINIVGWVANDRSYKCEEEGTGWFPSEKVRLFPNHSNIYFDNPVHEFVEPSLSRYGIEIRQCDIPIHHYGKLNKEKCSSKWDTYRNLGMKKLFERGDHDVMAFYELAVQAAELKQYNEALFYWQKALAVKADFLPAFYGIGNLYFNQGKYDEALPWYKRVLQASTSIREAIIMCSTCEIFVGDIARAITLLEGIINKESVPTAMFPLAAAYFCLDRKESGHELVRKLQAMNFSCAYYFPQIARVLINTGRHKYAILLLNAAIESNSITNETSVLINECYKVLEKNTSEGGFV